MARSLSVFASALMLLSASIALTGCTRDEPAPEPAPETIADIPDNEYAAPKTGDTPSPDKDAPDPDNAPFGGPEGDPAKPTCEDDVEKLSDRMYELKDRIAFLRASAAAAAGGTLPPSVARPEEPMEAAGCEKKKEWVNATIAAMEAEKQALENPAKSGDGDKPADGQPAPPAEEEE
jgi:hypothetical protein